MTDDIPSYFQNSMSPAWRISPGQRLEVPLTCCSLLNKGVRMESHDKFLTGMKWDLFTVPQLSSDCPIQLSERVLPGLIFKVLNIKQFAFHYVFRLRLIDFWKTYYNSLWSEYKIVYIFSLTRPGPTPSLRTGPRVRPWLWGWGGTTDTVRSGLSTVHILMKSALTWQNTLVPMLPWSFL